MIPFVLLFITTALFIQQYSRRGDLRGLDASMSSSVVITEPDQEFELSVLLRNRTIRFFPFLKLRIYIPEGLTFPKLKKGVLNKAASGGYELVMTTWLLPRQQLRIDIPTVISARGRYFTNGLNIAAGDFIGLNEMSTRYDDFVEIVCLPREADRSQALEIAGGFPGDLSVNRFIFEDPVLTIGYREYTGREPMRQISWTRSAQSGQLMVKEMDHTLESSVTVVVNIETSGENAQANMEKAYSMARYVCRELEDRHLNYSFVTNAVSTGSVKSFGFVGEGLGRTHFGYILEGLGRACYLTSKSCRQVLMEAVRRSSGSYGLVFITAGDEAGQCAEARRQASRAGLQILCINAGGEI
ncbi:MAG: DUF58 domain-containing protein [Firmicutes bacterium]|nr:DUF58 domain-containing protein [Bacillota bacterium]